MNHLRTQGVSRFALLLIVVLWGMSGVLAPALHATDSAAKEVSIQAVSLDGPVHVVTANTVQSVDVPHTAGTGTNRLMLVGVSWNSGSSARTISSVTFTPDGAAAVPLALVVSQKHGVAANYRYAAIYGLVDPPIGQAGTVTVNFTGGTVSNGIVVGVANFAGVDQTTPTGATNGAYSPSNNVTPTVTLSSLNGKELVFDTVFLGGNPPAGLTPGADQTVVTDGVTTWDAYSSNTRGAASTEQATSGSVTMSWTAASSSLWVTVAAAINPAAVGPAHDLTVAVSPEGSGTTSPAVGTHSYAEGSLQEVTATPATGYAFDHWGGDCSGDGACQVTMDSDKSVTAYFTTLPQHTLTVGTTGNGTVTLDPAGGTYYAGTTVTLTPAPTACNAFSNWSGADAGDILGSGPYTIVMDENKSVTGVFEELPPGTPCYRVNAGGDTLTAPEPDFLALHYANLGAIPGLTVSNVSGENSTSNTIDMSTVDPSLPMALFQTVLYRAAGSSAMTFAFAVPNGDYDVLLYEAEHQFSSAGQRLFDISIEGVLVFDDYDAFVAAGGQNIARTEHVPTTVSDGVLTIAITPVTSVASIRGIEIVPTSDTVPPTVTIDQAAGQADPTGTSPIIFTVLFSEPVADFVTGDVDLTSSTTGGTLAGTVTEIAPNDGTTYSVAVAGMTGSGDIVASINAGVAHDAADNPNEASTSGDNTVAFDATAPVVTINQAAGQVDPTNSSTINFTVAFNKVVTDFATGDVNLSSSTTGGTLVDTVTPAGSGTTFNVAVTGMAGSGDVIASIDAGVAHDALGNANLASTSTDNTVKYDVTAPTATIDQAAGQTDPTNGSTINFTVVFNEPMTGFDTGDVSLGGTAAPTTGTVSETAPNDGTTYNVAVSGMSGEGTVLANIAAGVAIDMAGNSNAASTSTDNRVTRDTTPPTVTIDQASGQVDPSSASPINFTVVFNETVADFGTGDVSLSGPAGATSAVVTGGPATYNVAVSGMTGSGDVVASINAGVAHDAAGNGNTASSSADNTVAFQTPPLTYIGDVGTVFADAAGTSLQIPVGVAGVAPGNGIIVGFASRGASPYDQPVVTDSKGNTYNLATYALTYQHGRSYIFYGRATTALAGGDFISITSSSVGSRVAVASVFSGLVGADPLDRKLGNPVPSDNATAQGNGPTVGPTATTVGANELIVGVIGTEDASSSADAGLGTWENGFTDGPTAKTSTGASYHWRVSMGYKIVSTIGEFTASKTYVNEPYWAASIATFKGPPDTSSPTVTINQASGQADPTGVSPIHFTVMFSEPVADFATGDVAVNSTGPGALVGTVTGSGTTYNVAVSGMSGAGTVTASVAAGAAHDTAGNPNDASISADNSVVYNPDTTGPTVTINQAAGQADPTSTSPIFFTVVFSEPVADFATGDVTLGGGAGATSGTVSEISPNDGTTFSVAVSGMTGSGTVTASIDAGAAHDAANNPNSASDSTDDTVTFNYVAPLIAHIGDIGSNALKDSAVEDLIVTTSAATASGDAIIVVYATDPSQDLTVGVTDSAGNKYLQAAMAISVGNLRTYVFAAYDVTALPSGGTISIHQTVVSATAVAARAAVVSVFRGLAPEGALEQSSVGSQTTGTTPSSGAATTVQADQLLIGAVGTEGPSEDLAGTWSNSFSGGPRSGTTGGTADTNITASMGWRIVSASGDYAATKSGITARDSATAIATFKNTAAGISYIGDLGSAQSKTAGTSLAVTTNAAVAAGDDILVTFAADPVAAVSSVTDSVGNTYENVVDITNSGNVRTMVSAAYNVTVLPKGSTITINHASVTARSAVVSVYRGLANSAVVDRTKSATGSTAAVSSTATDTTTQADELVIGAVGLEGPNGDAPSVWQNSFSYGPRLGTNFGSTGGGDTDVTAQMGWRIVGATGAYTAQIINLNTARDWAAAIATFKTQTAGPTCYTLNVGHTGDGTTPAASPLNSSGCPTGQYVSGESISLSGATPDPGWQIAGWTGTDDDSSTSTTNTVTMPAEAHAAIVVYVASPTQHILTVAVSPAWGGTTEPAVGTHDYAAGTVVNITATPAAGYGFAFWSGACSGSGGCKVTMNANQSVTANFETMLYLPVIQR
jgi:hypothetical protein